MGALGQKARLAVLWNTGFALFRDLFQFGVTLVLVRLLTPKVYGQSGLILNVIGFVGVFSFQNFVAHTLQLRRDEDVDYQQHFTAGAIIQLGLFVLTNLVAFGLRWLEPYAEIALLVHLMSLVFLLDLPNGLRMKMLERDLDWKRMRLLHAGGMIVARAAAMALALAGAGVYALLLPAFIINVPFIYDLFITKRWRPNWSWSPTTYAPAWRFGLTRVLSGMVGKGRQLLESGLFVRLGGFAGYGVYGRAVGLAELFCGRLAFLLLEAIYPAITKIEPRTDAYRRISALVLRCVAWIVIPVGVILAVTAGPAIRILYGDKWLEAIPLLPWTMAAGAAGALAYTAYMLLLANQQQKRCLLSDLWVLVGTGVSLLWLLPKGTRAYLLSLTLIQLVALVLMLGWLYRDQAITLTGMVGAIVQPVVATVVAFGLCEAIRRHGEGSINSIGIALAYGAAFSLAYLAVLRLLFAPLLRELVGYFPGGYRLTRLLMLRA